MAACVWYPGGSHQEFCWWYVWSRGIKKNIEKGVPSLIMRAFSGLCVYDEFLGARH